MTVAYDIATSVAADEDEWFGHTGTTPTTVVRGTPKFMTCVFMTGCTATSTLTAVTPADAIALTTWAVQASTLPAIPARPAPLLDLSAVPGMLQQLRRLSGLSWGEIARSVGVSRRTIHNWLGGAHVAATHLTLLLELSRVVNLAATGSAEATRAALLLPNANGRSLIDDLALAARPARRPLSSVSVGDLVTPVDEAASVSPQRSQRRSALRAGSMPRRRPDGL